MAIMAVCGLAVVLGLALAVRWRSYAFALDPGVSARGQPRLRSLARVLAVAALSGAISGVLIVGPTARLAMRLLAATSPDAQGKITEADEVVGKITLGGTILVVLVGGVAIGVGIALVYVFVSPAFPTGLLGGAAYGATLLVLFSWWFDPLRASNHDFDIIGPGWLAVATFAAMAVLSGVATVPITGRIDRVVGMPTKRWLWWLVPAGLLQVPLWWVWVETWPLLLLGAAACTVYLCVPSRQSTPRPRGRLILRAGVGAAVLLSLPGFIAAVIDIA